VRCRAQHLRCHGRHYPSGLRSDVLKLSCAAVLQTSVCLTGVVTTLIRYSVRIDNNNNHHYHHQHHHISVMELGQMLTRSGLTYPEVSSKGCYDSLCQLENSVSLPWVINYEAFYLHVVSCFSCIPVICPKLVLFLIPLQFVYLFCNLSKCILLFF